MQWPATWHAGQQELVLQPLLSSPSTVTRSQPLRPPEDLVSLCFADTSRWSLLSPRLLRWKPGHVWNLWEMYLFNFPTSVIQGGKLGGGWSGWWGSPSKLSAGGGREEAGKEMLTWLGVDLLGGITGGRGREGCIFMVLRHEAGGRIKTLNWTGCGQRKSMLQLRSNVLGKGYYFMMTFYEHLWNSGSSRDEFLLVPWTQPSNSLSSPSSPLFKSVVFQWAIFQWACFNFLYMPMCRK